ncbi:MAG: DUF3987 domain-containing protein [Prevotella sp.]|nr:DUF3987 domain-containing protein [Prevotella sp.]MDD7046316.1 DUF3987 domain-containing protein [Prevotella sp.]MDY5546058.1 DUF3987 domain-containing protein [Prevotella sp.]
MDNKNCIQNNPEAAPAHAAFSCAPNIKAAMQTVPCTQEWWKATKQDSMVADIIDSIAQLNLQYETGCLTDNDYREAVKALKEKLPVACINATFNDGHRCQESAVATGKLLFDFDHVGNPLQLWKLISKRLKDLGLEHLICLVEVSPSGKGLHVVIIIPRGLDAATAHQWFSELLGPLGANIDHAVKDLPRAVYMVPEEYTLYANQPLLFTDHSQPESRPEVASAEAWLSSPSNAPATVFLPCTEVTAETASAFIPYEQADPPLSNSEMVGIVKSACRPVISQLKASNVLHQALAEAREEMEQEEATDADEPVHPIYADEPPPLPKKLPKLLKMILSIYPDRLKPMIANAIFGILSAYLSEVSFKVFDDDIPKTINLTTLVVGESASGKGYLNRAINQVKERIKQRDAPAREKLDKYNEEKAMRGKLKDSPSRPRDVIQLVDNDTSKAAFVAALRNAGNRPLFFYADEVDNLKPLGNGDGKSYEFLSKIIRATYGGSEWGQMRVSAEATTARARMKAIITACTTPNKYLKVFGSMVTDGTVSRINTIWVPNLPFGAKKDKVKAYPDDFQEQLKPILDNLENMKGTINYKKIVDLSRELEEEMRQLEGKMKDAFLQKMRSRAQEIALWKGVALFVANGCKWDPTFKSFVKWSLYHDLWCKNYLFRETWEEQNSRDNSHLQNCRKHAGYLAQLPDTFTYHDAKNVILKNNPSAKDVGSTIRSWIHKDKVERLPNNTYRKVKKNHSGKEGK